ncbi:MAG: lamin tail domain-containing protein, partial [Proteobacteria bacterium]|nr:lamin tail domain-containing protein [Pseudomonadota bacterium]
MLKRLCFVTVLVLAALVGLLGMEVRADIVVNEVMNNPTDNARDEYIELYNTGLGAVDVANWTFSDGTSSDTIVAGNIRFVPGNDTGVAGYDTTTTNIPAGGYAVILDPQYVGGTTPYNFLAGTIILTIETSVTLGTTSLAVNEPITLFNAGGVPVSTYGGYSSLPSGNRSVERRNPTVDDVLCNWTDGSDSSPGAQNAAYDATFSLPTADAGNNQTIDSGSSVPIGGSPTATGGTGSYTYLWTPDDGSLSDTTNSNPTASPSSTTNYTVTVTDSNGCTATDQVTVTVLPPLTNQTGVSLFGPGTMGVWQDSRNGNWDIYVRDLGPDETFNTGDDVGDSPITTNNKHQQEPDVWVSLADTALIVWTDFRHSADTQAQPYGEIYYATYDKTTGVAGETRVTNDLFYQSEPAVYENTIVYTDNKSGGNGEDLYYHDRGTGLNTLLNAASGPGNQSNADIYGNTVAYQDNVSGNEDIYAVNITTAVKTTIFSGAGRQTNPAIDSFDGRYVAYQSNASGNWDIFVYDFVMGTTTSVAATAANEEYPSIHRGRVAFQREDNLFVYYINGGATYQVTNNAGTVESVKPSIYGPIVGCQERPDQYTLYERNFYTLPDPYGDTPPGVPTGVLESSSCVTVDRDYICSDTFQVHWTAPGDTSPSGFSHYVVEESIDSAAWTNLGTTTATCYPCTGRLHSKFYKYRVKAVSNSGTESAPTASNGITVDSDLPDSPGQPVEGDLVCNSGPDQTYDDNGTYRVSWDAATDAESGIASYELQEDTGALNWQTVATITAPTTCQIINGKSHGV